MINRLKRKFLVLGTVFMFILMSVLILVLNAVNYHEVTSESDLTLDVLAQIDGNFPGGPQPHGERPDHPDDFDGLMPRGMSREIPYESRYFVVEVSENGKILKSDLSRIISVDESSAEEYAGKAMSGNSSRGFIDQFRYSKTDSQGSTKIIFLDCGRKLDSFRSFLLISVIVGLCGCVVTFIAFFFAAGKIVAPIAESYEKQKRFISDAGHEIKTPLTIINANVDLLETEGENEELTDIRSQTQRLTELTNNLIQLSKMEESGNTMRKIEFPISDLVTETAGSFRAPAAARSLTLKMDVAPGISVNGSPDAIRQLISILLENAVKYAPDSSEISVELRQHRKSAVLSVANPVAETITNKDITHVFDRFYRTDASRNSQTGGHGIGLSVAKAIVSAHGGNISASTETGNDFHITATIPL